MSLVIRSCTTRISCFKKIFWSSKKPRNQASQHLRDSKLKLKLKFLRNLRLGLLVQDCLIRTFQLLFNLSDTKKKKKKKKLKTKKIWTKLKKGVNNSSKTKEGPRKSRSMSGLNRRLHPSKSLQDSSQISHNCFHAKLLVKNWTLPSKSPSQNQYRNHHSRILPLSKTKILFLISVSSKTNLMNQMKLSNAITMRWPNS